MEVVFFADNGQGGDKKPPSNPPKKGGGSGKPPVGGSCFVAGTKIHTPNGMISIENLQIGERINAQFISEHHQWTLLDTLPFADHLQQSSIMTSDIGFTFIGTTTELILITIPGDTIQCTPTHPFWSVTRNTWILSGELTIDDVLLDIHGNEIHIHRIQHVYLKQPLPIYNIEVAELHNFFVGETGILVHNKPP